MNLISLLGPELVLIAVACVLFLLGTSTKVVSRRASAYIALLTLAGIFVWQLGNFLDDPAVAMVPDAWNAMHVGGFTTFVNMIVAGMGTLLLLLAWPGNSDATGSASMNFGAESGEFFALALLSLAGVMIVGGANDIILLFLGIELASIPTYIMVSISRPLPVAQEAGVKYFFLGAMAAAVMLFGFSYIYGSTGKIKLDEIAGVVNATRDAATGGWGAAGVDIWLLLGVIMLLAGFAFKIAAVPLHAYAGDVYQGAATPMTAFLAFVPKTTGFLAIIKLLSAVGGEHWVVPDPVIKTLWVVAFLTMTVGNVLGLLQLNVKRVFAYSSIAHSGYMLVGITALVAAAQSNSHEGAVGIQTKAIQGVLFYLLSYGIMNSGAFGILMLLPSRANRGMDPGEKAVVATTAETFEDLAGQGPAHPILGAGMAICCFSLTGLPLTVGFFSKFYLVAAAWDAKLQALVVLMMLNAAISAAYYLKIIATMWIRPAPAPISGEPVEAMPERSLPLMAGVALAVVATLFLGTILRFTDALTIRIGQAAGTATITPISPTPMPSTRPTTIPAAPPVASAAAPVQAALR